jgi:hypothetical protein
MTKFYVVLRGEKQSPDDSYTAIVEALTTQEAGKKAKKEFKAALREDNTDAGKIHILVGMSGEAKVEGFGFQAGMWG